MRKKRTFASDEMVISVLQVSQEANSHYYEAIICELHKCYQGIDLEQYTLQENNKKPTFGYQKYPHLRKIPATSVICTVNQKVRDNEMYHTLLNVF